MTGAHYFFLLYAKVVCDHAPAQGNVEDFNFVSEVPQSNHHTVGTASWQNHYSSSRSLLLYCTAMFVYVYQTTTFPPHYGDNVKVKTQHIYQAMGIPVLLRGWGEVVVTNDLRIIYSPCADPECFASGGPTLQCFFFFIGGSKYHYISGPSSAHQ